MATETVTPVVSSAADTSSADIVFSADTLGPLPNHGRGVTRKHSSDSDSSPIKPATKKTFLENSEMESIEEKLDRIILEQSAMRSSIEDRLKNLETRLNNKIETECKKIKEDLELQIAQVDSDVKAVEIKVADINTQVEEKIKGWESRISTLETRAADCDNFREPYDSEVTVIVTGMQYSAEEDVLAKSKELVQAAMGQQPCNVVNAMRTPFRNNKPGILKIELENKDSKISLLRSKGNLVNNSRFSRVFIRGSQTHIERLLHLNTMTVLQEIGADQRYRVTGNGRLVPRTDPTAGAYGQPHGGPWHNTPPQHPAPMTHPTGPPHRPPGPPGPPPGFQYPSGGPGTNPHAHMTGYQHYTSSHQFPHPQPPINNQQNHSSNMGQTATS